MNLREQEEILRIKLLMGYNTKKTLSENYNKVIKEAPETTNPPQLYAKLDAPKAPGLGKKLIPPNYPGAPSDQLWYLTLFLNTNPDEIAPGKKYNYLWLDFLNKVKGANLEALLDARNGALTYEVTIDGKKYSPYDLSIGGGITPDLPNFEGKAGFTGVATSVLDSTIFGLRLKDYLKKKEEYDKARTEKYGSFEYKVDSKGKLLLEPVEPKEPQWHLLKKATVNRVSMSTTDNTSKYLEGVDAYGKSANEILYSYEEKRKKEKEEKGEETTCYFKSKEEGDDFRLWVNINYKSLAEKKLSEGGLELSVSGKYCNSYINDAYNYKIKEESNKTLGQLYKEFKSYKPKQKEDDPLYFDQTLPSDYLGPNGQFLTSIGFSETQIQQTEKLGMDAMAQRYGHKSSSADVEIKAQEDLKIQAKKLESEGVFDMSKFPTKTGEAILMKEPGPSSGCVPWYYGTSPFFYGKGPVVFWVEPNTKIKVTIHCKTEEQVLIDLTNLLQEKQIKEYQDSLLNDEKMWEIFGKDKLMKANQECPYKLKEFLSQVATGQIYDEQTGLNYGVYNISSKGRPYIVRWKKKIPCENQFWDNYGGTIQGVVMVASLLLSIPTFGGSLLYTFGVGMTTRLFIAAALDFGVNLYSAKVNMDAGREEEAQLDMAVALLSVAVDIIPNLSKALSAGLDDWAEIEITTCFKTMVENGTIKSYADFVKYAQGLSPTRQKVLKQALGNPQLKDVLGGLKEAANSPIPRIEKAIDLKLGKYIGKSNLSLTIESIWKNVRFKVPITMSPMIIDRGIKLYTMFTESYYEQYGKNPNEEILKKFYENYEKYFSNLTNDEIAEEIAQNPASIKTIIGDPKYQEYYANGVWEKAKVIDKDGKEIPLAQSIKSKMDLLKQLDEESKIEKIQLQPLTPEEENDCKEFLEKTNLKDKVEAIKGEIPK